MFFVVLDFTIKFMVVSKIDYTIVKPDMEWRKNCRINFCKDDSTSVVHY